MSLPRFARRTASLIAAILLILGTGLAHGLWTGRWHVSEVIQQAAARLDQVPMNVGSWKGEDVAGLSPQDLEVSQFAGHLVRRYRDATSDSTVTVMIACGHPGPLSLHSPAWCYAGSGYRESAHPSEDTLAGGSSVRGTLFHKPDAEATASLRIVWCWSSDGTWQGPENPRLFYARDRVLFKLYVVTNAEPGQERESQDRCLRFLDAFLPAIESVLFPRASS